MAFITDANGIIQEINFSPTVLDTNGYYTKGEILDKTYPVGAVYLTVDITQTPSSIFGGTWEALNNLSIGSATVYVWKRTA